MANKVNLDVSENDITCRRGDTFSLPFDLKDSSGTAIQLDTLGYSFLMDVKTNPAQSRGKSVQREVVALALGLNLFQKLMALTVLSLQCY